MYLLINSDKATPEIVNLDELRKRRKFAKMATCEIVEHWQKRTIHYQVHKTLTPCSWQVYDGGLGGALAQLSRMA